MDPALRLRLDIGLVLLASIAGTTAVAAAELADPGTVVVAAAGLVVLTGIVLFLVTTPAWAREGSDADGGRDGTDAD